MAKRLTITYPAGRDSHFYSRVLDFGEALHGPVVRGGLGVPCDLDRFTEAVWIDLADPHHLGKLKTIVRKQLGRARLTAEAVLTVGDSGPTAR